MKKTFLVITAAILLGAGTSSAQDEKNPAKKDDNIKTLFGNKSLSHGGYASLSVGYSEVNDKNAYNTGFRGAWIIGHTFAIGIGACGFSNDLNIDNVPGAHEYGLRGGYGGLLMEPILLPKFPVHLSFPILLGAGGVEYVNSYYNDNFDRFTYVEDSDAFFVAEPGVELEMNLLKFVRLAIGASYRFTKDVNIENEKHDVLNGYNFGLALKFGKF